MLNRKVTYARLHQGIYVPQAGDLGAVLPPSSKTLENLHMHTDGNGLFLDFNYRGIKNSTFIPLANIIIMSLAPEEAPAKEVKAK